jgi:hypothetical protein
MNNQQSTVSHFNIKKGIGRGMNKSNTTTVENVDGRDARLNLLRTTQQPTKETGQQTKGKKSKKGRHNNT